MAESAPVEGKLEETVPPTKRRTTVEIKLFVGKLPTTATEEAVKSIFSEYGTVLEVMILRDKMTNAHKGSAFVRMASIREADFAIRSLLNNNSLDPKFKKMIVSYAVGEPERLGFSPNVLIPEIDEAKIFIGSLPRNIDESDILKYFSEYGDCHDPYLMRDPETKKLKGCGFLKFTQKEDALALIQSLHKNVTFPGGSRPLEIRIAEPKRVFQQYNQHLNIPPPFQSSEIDSFSMMPSRCEINMVPRAILPLYVHPPGRPDLSIQSHLPFLYDCPSKEQPFYPRTAGFWKEYFTAEGMPYYYNYKTLATQWIVPKEFSEIARPKLLQVENSTGPQGANIFVFHVPSNWTKEDLLLQFSPFGHVLSAMVVIDPVTLKNKGYGFVSYSNIGSAIRAVNEMNLVSVGNKRLRVAIKVGETEFAKKYAQDHNIPFHQPEARGTNPLKGQFSNSKAPPVKRPHNFTSQVPYTPTAEQNQTASHRTILANEIELPNTNANFETFSLSTTQYANNSENSNLASNS